MLGTEHAFLLLQGERVSSASWFNLSRQALQPLFQRCARVQVQLQPGAAASGGTAVSLSTLEACIDQQAAAYEGGSCLRLQGAQSSLGSRLPALFRSQRMHWLLCSHWLCGLTALLHMEAVE